MSKFDNYIETGIEWIGKIPSDWQLSVAGKFFKERIEKVDDVTYPPLSVTMSGIVDQLSEVAKSNDGDNRKLVKKGDFVINSRSDRKGSSGISPRDGSVSLINIVLQPKKLNPNYIQYLFKSYYFKEEFFRNGKGIHWDLWTTRWDQFKNIFIPIPSNEEQKLISYYLDRKSEQIDKLIEKIQRKIELLNEQRTSLINQYITKGLDLNVKIKNSNVEWIGDIPVHWNLNKVGNNTYVKGRIGWKGLRSEDFIDEGPFLITGTDFKSNGTINWENVYHVDQERYDEDPYIQLQDHDVLITKDGTIGKIVYVGNLKGQTCLNSGIFLTRPINEEYIPRYFFWVLNSNIFKTFVKFNSGGSTILHLYQNVFVKFKFPIPPIHEQKEIVNYLDKQTKLIDHALSTEKKRIKLLKEYYQSLIFNIVTGKIRINKNMI